VSKFYQWYDRLEEPWRFLFFLLVVPVLGLAPLSFGNPTVKGIAAGYLVLLLVTRMFYTSRRKLAKAKASQEE
jgi:hypothetical protein